jgi:hypothetical protein
VSPVDGVKVLRTGEAKETLSVLRTQYSIINTLTFKIKQKTMKNKFVLDTLPAAHALAVDVLKKADRVFYRQRRIMEDSYGMTHGTLSGV